MINTDRIVPITAINLITLYSVVLAAAGVSATKLDAAAPGEFEQTTDEATVLCSEPVKTFGFGSEVTAGTVYFVPALDYKGFTINGVATTTEGDTVTADGCTLYKVIFANGTITIEKVGL